MRPASAARNSPSRPKSNGDNNAASPSPRSGSHRFALVALVLGNLAPLVGVVLAGWNAGDVVVLYWAENLVIGFFTLVKMFHKQHWRAIFPGAFFLLHFGAFCAAHGALILTLTGMEANPHGEGAALSDVPFLGLVVHAIDVLIHAQSGTVLLALLAIYVSHGVSLVFNYFLRAEYRHTTMNQLMVAPYQRIMITHINVIVGAVVVQAFQSPLPLLLVLIALKTGVDIRAHLRTHRQSPSSATSS